MALPDHSSPSHSRVDTKSFKDLKDHLSLSAQAQILITALQNVTIPLIRMAVPDAQDLHRIPLGPEAQDFLIALQKYISSLIRDSSHSENGKAGVTRTVDLDEPEAYLTTNSARRVAGKPELNNGPSRSILSPREDFWRRAEAVRLKNLDMALTGLRLHVFNEMPIRILAFTKHSSNLNITLLDRNGLYSLLASKLDQISKVEQWCFKSWEYINLNGDYSELASYAILSHTWLRSPSGPGEVTYSEWPKIVFDPAQPGYRKLVNFCKVAIEDHGLTLGWMDTICINKDSSSELDESIRSMFKWYQKAKVCITYLAETTSLDESDMTKDAWFTRGWTLQELLAPKCIKFYGSDWRKLVNSPSESNDKRNSIIQRKIELATALTPDELSSSTWDSVPISRKMQWAAEREVTRGEDAAYSLMGIFNVNMSIAYGEGAESAFIRLIKEILNTPKTDVLDIFNWAGDYCSDLSILIPSSPRAYLDCQKFPPNLKIREPLTMTHLGLRVPVLLLPAVPTNPSIPTYTPIGDYHATVNVSSIPSEHLQAKLFNVLDIRLSEIDAFCCYVDHTRCRLALAVLNSSGDDFSVDIPRQCFAIAILYNYDSPAGSIVTPLAYVRKVQTIEPIVFDLQTTQPSLSAPQTSHSQLQYRRHSLHRNQLARHGMQYLTMHL